MPSPLTDEMKKLLYAQMLMQTGAGMLGASAPSTDPRSGSMAYALSQGLGGVISGQQQGMAGIIAQMQLTDMMKKRQLEEEARGIRQDISGKLFTEPQGIASMVGGGTLTEGGQVIPQGSVMMGNRAIPRGMADIIRAGLTTGEISLPGVAGMMTTDKKDLVNVAQGGAVYNPETGQVEYINPKIEESKEINLAPIIDMFLTRKFGSAYTSATPSNRKQYINYLATPEGRIEFEKEAPKLMQMTATPFYQVVPTAEGLMQFNTRQPGQGPVATGAGKPLSSEMITAEQQFQTMKDSLETVKGLYKPKYVGAIQGRVGSLKETTTGVRTEQAIFYSALEGIKNALIYALSGKQINESEYKRLLRQLPDRNLPDNVFNARIVEFERVLNSIIENRQKLMGGYGIPTTKQSVENPLPKTDIKQELKKKYGLE